MQVHADAHDLPFTEASFDAVLARMCPELPERMAVVEPVSRRGEDIYACSGRHVSVSMATLRI